MNGENLKVQAIMPTAGTGQRFDAAQPKPLVLLQGKPLFVHTLEIFEKTPVIDSVVLVVHTAYRDEYAAIVKQHALTKIVKIIEGGATRFDSVSRGLEALDPGTDIVVIHDGARPLARPAMMSEAIDLCRTEEAVITAVPVKPTIKRVQAETLTVQATLDRSLLWAVQTPQVFKRDLIVRAYQQEIVFTPTDDAALVERLGVKVKVLPGDERNIKITTPEDLVVAEALVKQKNI